MTHGFLERVGLAACLLVFLLCVAGSADVRTDLALRTGLDPDLVGVLQIDDVGTQVTIVLVFLDARAFESRMSPALRALLAPFVGRNALYVNPSVSTSAGGFPFDPASLLLETAGRSEPLSAEAWMEITPGFLSGAFAANPGGVAQGYGSEGVLVLGEAVDPVLGFALTYGTARAEFRIVSDREIDRAQATSPAQTSIVVPALDDSLTLGTLLAAAEASEASISALFGLDERLVRVLEIGHGGGLLRLVFVRLEASVRESQLGWDLLSRIDPLIGTGAAMVWAVCPDGGAFTPWGLYVQQDATNYVFFSPSSFVELTRDFLRVEGLAPGELAAGVLRLPRGVDPAAPFTIAYQTSRVTYP
ncbi:MAG: hypothetical protein AB1778_03315 [Candidatus Bipolaricaulota bacterium]